MNRLVPEALYSAKRSREAYERECNYQSKCASLIAKRIREYDPHGYKLAALLRSHGKSLN